MPYRNFFTIFFILTISPLFALAQPTVIRAGALLDVRTGELVRPAVVVVEDGLIQSVNPASVPTGAEEIDLGEGATLLPGLIDAHVHLTGQLAPNMQLRAVTETSTERALHGVLYAKRTLMAGFTTVRDLGSDGFSNIALMKAVQQGYIEGPDIIPAGHALSITGGHGDAGGYAPGILEGDYREGVADGVDEVVKAVRYQIKQGAKVIKVFATAGVLSFEEALGAQQYTYEELKAAVDEAARHGIKVAAHAHGVEGIKAAVRAGVASIEHGSILDDETIALMIEHGTYLVPTTYLTEAVDMDMLPPLLAEKGKRVIPMAQQSLERAIAAGVKIAFGTDAAVIPHGDNGKEFAVLAKRGMSPIETIRSATLNAADLLGLTDRGAIEAGLRADIIAVVGNPLEGVEVLERPVKVMKGGFFLDLQKK